MVNKKAYIRTIESVIAIVLVFIFIFTIMPKQPAPPATAPEGIRLTQNAILNQIESNDAIRNSLSNYYNNGNGYFTNLKGFIDNVMPQSYNYTISICPTQVTATSPCACMTTETTNSYPCQYPKDLPQKSVYTKSVLIAQSGSSAYVVRLYIWQK